MLETSPLFWGTFTAILIALLAFDLGVVGRQKSVIGIRESLLLTAGYVAVALLFGAAVFAVKGTNAGMEYLTGFLLEKSLSLDNIFVFVVIFGHFHVPREYQHRVLFWGILGALIMRAVMIFAGVALLNAIEWVIYIFAAIVILSGIRLMIKGDDEPDLEDNRILKFVRRFVRVTQNFEGRRFFVRRDGARWATPLFLTLVLIESSDLIFALDSIPAIFGVTRDPFIIYTSNAFAILGLRALYFALAGVVAKFAYLHYGLSLVLIMIGIKMIAEEFVHIPIYVTLGATVLLVGGAMLVSILLSRRERAAEAAKS